MKLKIREGQEIEVCKMIIDCCQEERTFLRFYGLLAERYTLLNPVYCDIFHQCFQESYLDIHNLEVNKLRNAAKLFAHLFVTDSMKWDALSCIKLIEDETTSANRIFIKILFEEMFEHLGMKKLIEKLAEPTIQPALAGVFPKTSVKHAKFAVNFFTSIGLGALTEDLRNFVENAPKLLLEQKLKEFQELEAQSSSSSDSDSDSSSMSHDSDDGDGMSEHSGDKDSN